MCGIAGMVVVRDFASAAERDAALGVPLETVIPESMLDELEAGIAHRGPDGRGRFRDRGVWEDSACGPCALGGAVGKDETGAPIEAGASRDVAAACRTIYCIVDVAFVHRRLSIIDLSDGAQPMIAEPRTASAGANSGERKDDRLAVVFNGCIYNHRALRAELEAAGHVFKTNHSDTEVLLHGHRQWDDELTERLNGMFAYAIWDRARAMVVLCRDRFGEKPLYLRDGQIGEHQAFAFSSVEASLECVGGLEYGEHRWIGSPEPRPGVSPHWRDMGFSIGTPIGRMVELTPGGRFVLSTPITEMRLSHVKNDRNHGDGVIGTFHGRTAPRWDPRRPRRDKTLTADEVDRLLDSAVSLRLDADVPVGVFLSGGIDSALIATYAKRHKSEIEAFTVAMPDARYDESAQAAATAKQLGIRHHVLECKPTPAADMVRLIEQIGLPLGDSSLLPTYWLCEAVRRHVPVALSGDGGDELFAGYERYRAAKYLANPFVRAIGKVSNLLPWWGGADPKTKRFRAARFLHAAGAGGYSDLLALFNDHPDRWEEWSAEEKFEWNHLDDGPIVRAIAHDLLNYLPADLCRKVDSASMSVALEVRAPFLDQHLATAATRATIDSLMPGGQRKGLLREVARRHLPAEIVDRPKTGFAIPIGEWFRTDFGGMKSLLMERLSIPDPFHGLPVYPDRSAKQTQRDVARRIEEHLSGRRDHSQGLYGWLALAIWARWYTSRTRPDRT